MVVHPVNKIRKYIFYFCLLYQRLSLGLADIKSFKERQRDPREMQKDIDLKNRYLIFLTFKVHQIAIFLIFFKFTEYKPKK